jgi:4a-hydroxytetrahydrobiopterin dehydratase
MNQPTAKDLAKKKCVPCEGGVPALTKDQAEEYLVDLPNWILGEDGKSIRTEYLMKNFLAAVDLIQKLAEVAEAEGHHPDIHLTGYRKLAVVLSTHAIGGLSENDFILAAKIEQLPKNLKTPVK